VPFFNVSVSDFIIEYNRNLFENRSAYMNTGQEKISFSKNKAHRPFCPSSTLFVYSLF